MTHSFLLLGSNHGLPILISSSSFLPIPQVSGSLPFLSFHVCFSFSSLNLLAAFSIMQLKSIKILDQDSFLIRFLIPNSVNNPYISLSPYFPLRNLGSNPFSSPTPISLLFSLKIIQNPPLEHPVENTFFFLLLISNQQIKTPSYLIFVAGLSPNPD